MPILRPCSGALATALAAGNIANQADLFTCTSRGGTVYQWTSWSTDLTVGADTFTSAGQWLKRGSWGVKNTMVVPTLEVFIDESEGAFAGGASLRNQIQNGLFDGASWLVQRLFMPANLDTSVYGTIDLFAGDSGAAQVTGSTITIKVRGKNSRLNVMAPRNLYQPGCIHTFCDSGCTLSAPSFRIGYTLFAASRTILTMAPGTAVMLNAQVKGGTVTMQTGALTGATATVIDYLTVPIVSTFYLISLTLAYPLIVAPARGDVFTLLYACDKTLTTCNTVYSNKVNFRGFPFIPPPATNAPGQ